MAFELIVACEKPIPSDLRERWPELLAKHGIQCEIHPDFTPESWNGGFLPFKIDEMPSHFIGEEIASPAMSGFEVDFDESSASFRSAMGRTTTEFSLLCLCAAELTQITNGEYHDPQSGHSFAASDCMEAALAEIRATLDFDGAADRIQHPFHRWN